MPNWCNNVLELAHKDPAMIERARVAFNEDRLLEEFVPVPEDLKITAGFLSDELEQAKLEDQEKINFAKYGYKNWYDFSVGEWGTKWDVCSEGCPADVSPDNRLTMSFDSAWSPPIGAYEKLTDLGFEVRAYYYESGMCYAGIWEDGIDDYYDMSDCANADEAEATLPSILDEMFCISENMREWEEENAEEEE
ncbi:hypothetical protein UFOVP181_459 [uncultured Caudovirales phage]|uniref:YubB ferredoxin-like domain-containing protein n=1 Tax=uncultured Caudovirales phage TaxID=2100421 RepID=A0A6J7WE94_9CAUD|nr:hypothetical protein UFOVP57_182 [uncultured Caudovirales phage]CAB5209388.1 hypothetical protein UFOVP181_459 [uncultured Caudovirales phage]